ncbi:hypothetical protein N1851_000375 [Merluccius polli]|uniref:Fibronectin type-III domain-containing protein n=1 Tax=Merluccius polli TaxID=89951 RepID=A0AA47NC68_MERPO|nr:hypothetical protein N1851_000375 [Merluccius polli]
MVLHIPWIGFRLYYLGFFLLNSVSVATHGTGLNLSCTNDFERLMLCEFSPPQGGPDCGDYHLNTRVEDSVRNTNANCNFTHDDTVRTGTCSCSLDIKGGFVWMEVFHTTLWKAGVLVESKNIIPSDNIKPKAPTITSVKRDPENGNYLLEWKTNYTPYPEFTLKAVVTYGRRGENGTEASVGLITCQILAKSLEPSTEYLVNIRSYNGNHERSVDTLYSESTVSSTTIAVAVILSLCVAAIVITSFLYLLYTRFKEKWWDNVGKYKNSTLLLMVPREHQKVSFDIISNVEDAMRRALPQFLLLPTPAPWLDIAHSNASYNPVVLSESGYNPSMWRGALHHPSPISQVPIFQLTGQRQPLVSRLHSSHMKTDLSYQSWNADSGSSSTTIALQVNLSYSSAPSDTTSTSILSDFGSSVYGVGSKGELQSKNLNESLLGQAADPSSMSEHVYGEEELSVKVCDPYPWEASGPAPACSLVPVDDDYQGFQSVVRRPGLLIPEASSSSPRDQLDGLPETLVTGMPQRAVDAAWLSMVGTLPTTQGLLEPQANTVSVLPGDQHKIIIISTGLNLSCTNDFERLMLCEFSPPQGGPDCGDYHLNTSVEGSVRNTNANCNFTHDDTVWTGTCSCSLDIKGGFVWSEVFHTKLWKAGVLVESKNINASNNIKPKAPTIPSVKRDPENGNYLLEWKKNYTPYPGFPLKAVVTYGRRGENGTEASIDRSTTYQILGTSLEPSTEYWVNVRSYNGYHERSVNTLYSESSGNLTFTTPVSSTTIAVAVILSLCVAAIVITSFLYLLYTRVMMSSVKDDVIVQIVFFQIIFVVCVSRFKEKWWDNVGKYKNSTLLLMVPGEHQVHGFISMYITKLYLTFLVQVLMPQKTTLCSVYVDSRKEDKDDEKPWWVKIAVSDCVDNDDVERLNDSHSPSPGFSFRDSSRGGNSHQSAGADSVSSSLGCTQKVSVDIISNVEDAMRRALPQILLLPTPAPWLDIAHSNASYNPVVLSESLYNPSMLRGALHHPSPDSQVPIFQLIGQRQPLVSSLYSSYMKTDFSYQGSSSTTIALHDNLSYSSAPSDTTSTSILSDFGSSVYGVGSKGELQSKNLNESLLGQAADPSSILEHVYGEEELSVKVCDPYPWEASGPAPACSLVPVDDDYQGFQSVVRRPGLLIPEASSSSPRDRLDGLPETLVTRMPQRAVAAAWLSMVGTLPTTQGLLEPQANTVSVLPGDQHKIIIISDYHSV